MHAKLVFLKDIVQEKLEANWWQLYRAEAVMFVYFAVLHAYSTLQGAYGTRIGIEQRQRQTNEFLGL